MVSRRSFLRSLGTATVSTALGPIVLRAIGGPATSAWAADTLDDTLPLGTPIVVAIELAGGNDPLNTLVPVNDPWYYSRSVGHGDLAIPPDQALPLAGASDFGLHPNLSWLAGRSASRGDVAFVAGVGEEVTREFSHFAAAKQWYAADFSGAEPLGWLGRYNDLAHASSQSAGISLSGRHPALVANTCAVLVAEDVGGFGFGIDWRARDEGAFARAAQAMAEVAGPTNAARAAAMIEQAWAADARFDRANDESLVIGVERHELAWQLLQAAMLIRNGVPCQTYAAVQDGYDTHSSQATDHPPLLAALDHGLERFFAAIDSSDRRDDVFVVVTSEFGRKVTANETGTDHGQAGLALVIGAGVRGGIHGDVPTLDPGGPTAPHRIEDALRPTVDFRRLYATVLDRLGGDGDLTSQVLRSEQAALRLFT